MIAAVFKLLNSKEAKQIQVYKNTNYNFSNIQPNHFREKFNWNLEIIATVLVGCVLLITSIIGVMTVRKVRKIMRTNGNIRKVRTEDVKQNELSSLAGI